MFPIVSGMVIVVTPDLSLGLQAAYQGDGTYFASEYSRQNCLMLMFVDRRRPFIDNKMASRIARM
jgi:hypothetical protein